MAMTGSEDLVGFEGEDDTIAPYVTIPWDRTIIKHSISLIKYDHTPRMIHDSTGKLKGVIFVDEDETIRWLAVDNDYFE